MPKKTYSLSDIGEMIGKPRNTLADWVRQFREFLPVVGEGRSARYEEEAVEIFRVIAAMKARSEPAEIIREQLRAEVRQIVIPQQEDTGKPLVMILLERQERANAVIFAKLEELEARINDGDRDRGEQLEEHRASVNEILEGLKTTAAAIEEIQVNVSELRRSDTHKKKKKWWGWGE